MSTPLSTAPPVSTATEPIDLEIVDVDVEVDADACGVCPHGLAGHDRVAQRFCLATLSGALTRGCICAKAG